MSHPQASCSGHHQTVPPRGARLRVLAMILGTALGQPLVQADPPVERVISFDAGEDTADGLTLLDMGDGHTQIVTIGGRLARQNANPAVDKHFYFNIDDVVAGSGSHLRADITIGYYDAGAGSFILQYDSTDPAPFPNNYYKSAGSIALTGTSQWRSQGFAIEDAYFGGRQNGGADFRIVYPPAAHFTIDVVTVTLYTPPEPPQPLPPTLLGATHAVGKYYFDPARDYLNEGAIEISRTGMRVIKLWFIPNNADGQYPWNGNWPQSFASLTEMAQYPDFTEVFRRPFETYLLTVVKRNFRDGFPDPMPAETEQEFYDLARHLLESYDGTRKTFILGTWESDWQLRGTFDLSPQYDPTQTAIDGMIRWYAARQAGVSRARQDVPDSDVHVYAAAEVNILGPDWAGRPTVTTHVLPHLAMDLVTYSAWGGTVPYADDETLLRTKFQEALAFIASYAPDSTTLSPSGVPFGDKNVAVAEFGYPEQEAGATGSARQARIARVVAEEGHAFGCPWVIYWQVYCNECCQPGDDPCTPNPGDLPGLQPADSNELCRGFWLRRVDGTYSPAHGVFTSIVAPFAVPPDDFDATVENAQSILLNWTNMGGTLQYRIERSDNDGAFTPVTIAPAGSSGMADQTVISGRRYRYRLRAEAAGLTPTAWFYSEPINTTARADIDRDGDVDLSDFGLLQACLGQEVNSPADSCAPANLNADPAIDINDIHIMINCLSGPRQPPGC